jgi:hypothetical protein
MSGGKILEQIRIKLKNRHNGDLLSIYLNVHDNSLSRKWLGALGNLITNEYHLEKNYCFFGFPESARDGNYILQKINESIQAINQSDIGYHIDDYFDMTNTLEPGKVGAHLPGKKLRHEKFNQLHRYFEDLQGQSQRISRFANAADPAIKWHIRQLNLLCHEFESWASSYRKKDYAPEWQRPSQLMCWLNAPRFALDDEDHELFGIETLNRPLGGVFMGVNKSVGKHHWEVFNDEGRDSRISELTTSSLINQTEGSGDFDIEWGNDPSQYIWQQRRLDDFRKWLRTNGFDPDDKKLTIGHPPVGMIDLEESFGTNDYREIWYKLSQHLDVYEITIGCTVAVYDYHWSDCDFQKTQIEIIKGEQHV